MEKILHLTFVLLTVVFFGCKKDVVIVDYLDREIPLVFQEYILDEDTGLSSVKTDTLYTDSRKWNLFLNWCEANNSGWQESPVSYNGKVVLFQGNVKLIHLKNGKDSEGIVFSFTGEKGASFQYIKAIEIGEWDFLYP